MILALWQSVSEMPAVSGQIAGRNLPVGSANLRRVLTLRIGRRWRNQHRPPSHTGDREATSDKTGARNRGFIQ